MKGAIVNPSYRPCCYGDSSQVILRHCTRFFRGHCEHARCVDVFVMDENASKSEKSRSQDWRLFPAISNPSWNCLVFIFSCLALSDSSFKLLCSTRS